MEMEALMQRSWWPCSPNVKGLEGASRVSTGRSPMDTITVHLAE